MINPKIVDDLLVGLLDGPNPDGLSEMDRMRFTREVLSAAVEKLDARLGYTSLEKMVQVATLEMMKTRSDFIAIGPHNTLQNVPILVLVAQGQRGVAKLEEAYKKLPNVQCIKRQGKGNFN